MYLIIHSVFTSESVSVSNEEVGIYSNQIACENLYWQDRPEEMKKQGCDIQAISNEIYETIRGY